MGARSEDHILTAQADQLRHPQAGLDGHEEQGAVSPARPAARVGSGQQRLDLFAAQKVDGPACVAFARDGEDALAEQGLGRLPKSHVPEEGVNRGEAGVAGAGAVAPGALQMLQEVSDQGGVELLDREVGGGLAQSFAGEPEEQAEGIPVPGNGMGAGLPLAEQALLEEGLQERRKAR